VPPAWTENRDAFVFTNDDGAWTIYKRCFDRVVRARRWSAGPGYVVRMTDAFALRTCRAYPSCAAALSQFLADNPEIAAILEEFEAAAAA
jgi:hypothetical protein